MVTFSSHFKAFGKWKVIGVMLTQPRGKRMKVNKQIQTHNLYTQHIAAHDVLYRGPDEIRRDTERCRQDIAVFIKLYFSVAIAHQIGLTVTVPVPEPVQILLCAPVRNKAIIFALVPALVFSINDTCFKNTSHNCQSNRSASPISLMRCSKCSSLPVYSVTFTKSTFIY